jgi:hypothetical protein
MMRHAQIAAAVAAFGLTSLIGLSSAAVGQQLQGELLADGTLRPAGVLSVGQQQLLTDASGPLNFAGRELELEALSGVIGFSAEAAYVAVIAGTVSVGSIKVQPGHLLILPPFGQQPTVARFNAARLASRWSGEFAARHGVTMERLQEIARGQQVGVFFGRLGTTSLNLAAPGGAEAEIARRSVVGQQTVQELRYGASSDINALGRCVAERMLVALASRDEASVADLLDPVPYGNTDLTGGGGEARRLTARSLINRNDWPRLLAGATLRAGAGPDEWIAVSAAGSARINLRRMGDFVFVTSIVPESAT